MKLLKIDNAAIEAVGKDPAGEGRKFLCVGPHCFGFGQTVKEAIVNAKGNRSPVYEGKAGWRFIIFDTHRSADVDGMGSIAYIPEDIPDGQRPYTEVYRTPNMPAKVD